MVVLKICLNRKSAARYDILGHIIYTNLMDKTRRNIRRVVFGLTSIVVLILALRFFLLLLNAARSHFVTELIIDLSEPLVEPFTGTFAGTGFGSLIVSMEIIVAMVFFIFAGIFIAGTITAFIQEKVGRIFVEIIDIIFKVLEFILLARLVFKIFGIEGDSSFLNLIFSSTEWVAGLLPTVDVLGGSLEFSTLFILVAIVILDLVTEGVFEEMMKEDKKPTAEIQLRQPTYIQERPAAPAPQAPPQNITINVPTQFTPPPAPQPRQANPQVINIHAPKKKQGLPFNNKKR